MKPQISLVILFLLICIRVFPHTDTFYRYRYDNISVVIQTGFFSEEVNNVKIIGQYAALLSKKNKFDGQVLLFFGHDYIPDNYSFRRAFMSYQNNYVFEILGFNKTYIDSCDSILLNNDGKIVIQQFDFHFDIKLTLELLNFAMNNIDILKNDTERYNTLGYDIKSIKKEILDSVQLRDSFIVNDVLQNKIYIIPNEEMPIDGNFYVTYYSQFGKYVLFDNSKKAIDTLNQVLLISFERNSLIDYIVALESKDELSIYSSNFLDKKDYLKSKHHNVDLINFAEGISDIRLIILDWDILLVDFFNGVGGYTDMKFIYLYQEGILLTDFMDYINNH